MSAWSIPAQESDFLHHWTAGTYRLEMSLGTDSQPKLRFGGFSSTDGLKVTNGVQYQGRYESDLGGYVSFDDNAGRTWYWTPDGADGSHRCIKGSTVQPMSQASPSSEQIFFPETERFTEDDPPKRAE